MAPVRIKPTGFVFISAQADAGTGSVAEHRKQICRAQRFCNACHFGYYGSMQQIEVIVNGKPVLVAANSTVADLLVHFQLPPVRVAVEKNRELVPRKTFAVSALVPGDTLEIVSLVGGG